MNSRRAWLIWAIGVFAYLAGVLQRNSLGVSGVVAIERFHISAALLSSLAVVQLIVYAALQIPVGVLIDRLGPKFLIGTGALLMFTGQVIVAVAPTIGVAIVGRVLVGAGDAATFISVLRLLPSWFSGRILPQVTQWTANLGQAGQLLSALPLAFVLHEWGWTPAFIAAGAFALLSFVLSVTIISNGQGDPIDHLAEEVGMVRKLREALARPGTQLGFWCLFVTQPACTIFVVLWGYPFLTAGLGYDRSLAAALLGIVVLVGFVAGPAIGIFSAQFPLRRSVIVLGTVALIVAAWALVIFWPGTPPFWVVVVMIVAISVGGPGSMIGFDFARTFNPLRNLGSANGVVNIGGFLASFVLLYLIGQVLDLLNYARIQAGQPSDLFNLDSFRIAFSLQFVVIGIGVVFLLIARRKTRRTLHEEEGVEVAPLWKVAARALRRGNV